MTAQFKTLAEIKRANLPALPAGIEAADLLYPSWSDREKDPLVKDYTEQSFEMWYTARFGWCIPTLLIGRRPGPHGDRTYAVSVKDQGTVRIGAGPHLLHRVEVFVRQRREKALRPYLALRMTGQAKAGEIRDVISTRRLRGSLRRANMYGF